MTMHKWFVGAFLTAVMVTTLGANAMLFSARSFQHNLGQIAPSTNGVLDVQAFLEAETGIAALEGELVSERGEAIALKTQMEAARANAANDSLEATRLGADLSIRAADLEARLGAPAADAPTTGGAALAARFEALATARELSEADRGAIASGLADAARLLALEERIATLSADAEALAQQEASTAGALSQADQQILGLKAQIAPEGASQYDVIRNEAKAVLRSAPFGVNAALVQAHPHFLSIGLVLLMGLLGGILYLFPAYMSRAEPVTFSEIFVRMVFGMCTALAFYVIMNAAVAGFTLNPSGVADNGGQSALNPFSVSMIGIIAGIMADDIARWIHARGTDLLGGDAAVATRRPGGGLAPQVQRPASPPAPAAAAAAAPRAASQGAASHDPMDAAARDALRDQLGAPPASGDAPPKGGVFRR